MKIKKAIALVVTAALSVSSLAGCSQAAMNYGEELNKISQWEGYTTEGTGTYTISSEGISKTLNFTTSSYYSDNKTYSEVKYVDPEGIIKIPEIRTFCDGSLSYINKSYFENMFVMNGKAVPEELKNLNSDYIVLDSGFDTDKLKSITDVPKEYTVFAKALAGDRDIDLPYVQNGREYELNLDTDKIVELESLLIQNLSYKNSDGSSQMALNDQDKQNSEDELKELYAGSSITTKENFEDDKYTLNLNYDMKIKDSSEMKMTMDSVSTKCEKKDIVIPAGAVKLTQEEFAKIMGEEESADNSSALAKTIEETVK